MNPRTKGRIILLFIYLLAFTLSFWAASASGYSLLCQSAVMVALTVAILFLGSLDLNNSSVFDPYWSVAPPVMILFFVLMLLLGQPLDAGSWSMADNRWSEHNAYPLAGDAGSHGGWGYFPRLLMLSLLVLVYSVRLTWNFLRGWPGLKHEDWRYVNFRKQAGKGYWLVSLFGIHLFPALMVFGGTLSLWVVVVHGAERLNLLDILALLLTGTAILLEAVSDNQMRAFLRDPANAGAIMDRGLWGLSRHPNYLGEICFWWGLYLFALAANPSYWWVGVGPLAITLMFLFASIPMIEKRMVARRPGYADYQKKVSVLIPWKR